MSDPEIRYCLLCPAIKLNNGYRTLVDPEDYVSIKRTGWKAKKSKGGLYAIKYSKHHGRVRGTYLHRLVMATPKGLVVHHKNGYTLDNRKDNLQNLQQKEHRYYQTRKRITKRIGGKNRLKNQHL